MYLKKKQESYRNAKSLGYYYIKWICLLHSWKVQVIFFLNSDLYKSDKKFLCTMCLCIMVKYTESGVGGLCTIKIYPGIPVAYQWPV